MAETAKMKDESALSEIVSTIIQALLLALVIRTIFFQPFEIPSGSMKPTLLVGDYVMVSKWSYGYSRHSLPFSPPVFSGRVWGSDPERGDVVVFKYPPDPSKDYIKRVIGLPGDKVQLKNSVIHINGQAVEQVPKGAFAGNYKGRDISIPTMLERLDNGRTYEMMDVEPGSSGDDTGVYEVPAGHYFFMGDNRDNSADSRYDVGFVPAENLVGKAQTVFLSLEEGTRAWEFWKWPTEMRWGRLFTGL